MLLAGLLAAVIGLALQPVAIAALSRSGVLDHVNERSSHTTATARGGGIVVLLGVVAASLLAGGSPLAAVLTVALAAVVGLAEDLRGVPLLPRLLLQLAVGVPAALALTGDSPLLLVVLGPLYLAAVVNAFNFMDGVNGISAGTAGVAGLGYALLLAGVGEPGLAVLGAAVAGAALAFVPFNAPRARVFLGDSGSYGLGAALAVLSLGLLAAGATPEAAAAPLAPYLADTGTTLLRRWRAGEEWYLPHRTHAYQRLTDEGWSHTRVSLLMTGLVAAATALGAATLLGPMPRVLADVGLLVLVAGYLALPARLRRRREVQA